MNRSRPKKAGVLPAFLCLLCGMFVCAPEVHSEPRPALNSERIKAKFGSYGIEVLEQSARQRVGDLYSGTGEERVTRTLALVVFEPAAAEIDRAVHQAVVDGASLGATWAAAGWTVSKQTLMVADIRPLDDKAGLWARMGGLPPQSLALQVYRLSLAKGEGPKPYATILEVYHPDYLTLDDLVGSTILPEGLDPSLGPALDQLLPALDGF